MPADVKRPEEDDEGDSLDEDDPLSVLIDRIAAVKSSFEEFHSRFGCLISEKLILSVMSHESYLGQNACTAPELAELAA